MLRQRVLTALALLAVLLPALLSKQHSTPFATVTLLLIVAAGWEWARLNGWPGTAAIVFAALLAATGGLAIGTGASASAALPVLWWSATAAWVAGSTAALWKGPQGWAALLRALRCGGGWLALAVAWLALVQARGIGINFILSVFCLVWMADMAAYFGGRAFGRRKLAPSISPGKSWEGVASGLLGVMVLAAAWTVFDCHVDIDSLSLYSRLKGAFPVPVVVLWLLALGAMSVVGDLFESLVKRAAGVKDSSALLPGHGGVLDRIDALLPVFPFAMALNSLC